jgi:poly(3-hydroxybutyrate) depolymerase
MRTTLPALTPLLLALGCPSGTDRPADAGDDGTDGPVDGRVDADGAADDVVIDVPLPDGSADLPESSADDGGPGDVPPDAPADAPADDAGTDPPSTFELLDRAPEDCPLGALGCAGWPDAADGPVYRYTSREHRGAGSWDRTFHVHVPTGGTGPLPLVVMLHGGTGSGDQTLGSGNLDDLGDRRGAAGLDWRPNTDDCRAEPTTGLLPRYVDGTGDSCTPPRVSYFNARPFVSAFPDGVLDDGSTTQRHWEDGRIPSPGFGTVEQHRDDVGFIDHLIGVLLDEALVDIDPGAVYVVGGSNGGMMTQRLACAAGDPAYPNVGRVAAYAAMVSTLPAGLYDGADGRPACPRAAGADFGLLLLLGTDIDTPDCEVYGCDTPVVSGDGLIPYGEPGGRYHVNSPDNGLVLSGPDTIEFWRAALAARAGAAGSVATEPLGWFTERRRTTFPARTAVFEAWVTTGGGHMLGSTREDFAPNARAWWFVSSFRRDAAGGLEQVAPTWMLGTF